MADHQYADTDPNAPAADGERIQRKYLGIIDQYDKAFNDWTKRSRKLWKIYTEERRPKADQSTGSDARRMSLFWSNISTLQPAVYARTPAPNVTRRFKDDDPVARSAAEIVERSLITSYDTGKFDTILRQCRDDFLIPARGTAWVRYEADTDKIMDQEGNPLNERGEPVGEDESPAEEIKGERICYDYVNWEDFGHNVARTWDEVTCVWRRAYMSKSEGVKRFGKAKWATVAVADNSLSPADSDRADDTKQAVMQKAVVYEIWCKASNRVYFIARGAQEPLEVVAPYLQLSDFFPCPKPAYGTISTSSLIPTPDYVFYQDQVEEIDALTGRIAALQQALKLIGFYAGGPEGEGSPEIEKALQPGFENRMIEVRSWAAFKDGGKDGVPIIWLPVEHVATILKECVLLRKQLIDDVYQITGISDIMRGEGDKEETATAQNLKSQWGSIRIRERQNALAVFARDLSRIAGEIMADKFQPETLMEMSNLKLPTQAEVDQKMAAMQAQALQTGQPAQMPQKPPVTIDAVVALLRDDRLRTFKIDVETDSLVEADQQKEKAAAVELLTAVGEFAAKIGPICQSMPPLTPMFGALLQHAVRRFKPPASLEEMIETAMEKAGMLLSNPQPPQPSPDEQIKLEATKVKTQAEIQKAQIGAQQAQVEGQAKIAGTILDHQTKMREAQVDEHRSQQDFMRDQQRAVTGASMGVVER